LARKKAEAASQRTPPVQYMSTVRPRSSGSCASSHRGISENWRTGGSSVSTPAAWKWPSADS